VCGTGYPTVYAFTKKAGEEEKSTLFEGTPNSTTLTDFANKVLGQPCANLPTKDKAQQWLHKPGRLSLVAVGLVASAKSEITMVIQKAARDLLMESCAITDSKDVYKFLVDAVGIAHIDSPPVALVPTVPALALLDFEGGGLLGELKEGGFSSAAHVTRWVKGRRTPLTIEFRESNDQGKKHMERAKSHTLLLLELPEKVGVCI
jgi:hypothetical protein